MKDLMTTKEPTAELGPRLRLDDLTVDGIELSPEEIQAVSGGLRVKQVSWSSGGKADEWVWV